MRFNFELIQFIKENSLRIKRDFSLHGFFLIKETPNRLQRCPTLTIEFLGNCFLSVYTDRILLKAEAKAEPGSWPQSQPNRFQSEKEKPPKEERKKEIDFHHFLFSAKNGSWLELRLMTPSSDASYLLCLYRGGRYRGVPFQHQS